MWIPQSSQQAELMSWREQWPWAEGGKAEGSKLHLVDNGLFKKLLQGVSLSSCGQGFQSKNTSFMVQFYCCLSLQTINVTIQFNELGHAWRTFNTKTVLLKYQESTHFSSMQEFINTTAVSLDSHLKIGLYSISPFPAEELRQGSFIPTFSAKRSVPAGSSSRWLPGKLLGRATKAWPPATGPHLDQGGHLSYP